MSGIKGRKQEGEMGIDVYISISLFKSLIVLLSFNNRINRAFYKANYITMWICFFFLHKFLNKNSQIIKFGFDN